MQRSGNILVGAALGLALLIGGPLGCRTKARDSARNAKKAAQPRADKHRSPLPISAFLATVPDGAESAGLADLNFLRRTILDLLAGLIGRKDALAVLGEVDTVCKDKLGVTCTTLSRIGLWTGPENQEPVAVGFVLWGLEGTLTSGTSLGNGMEVSQEGNRVLLTNEPAKRLNAGHKGAFAARVAKLPKLVTDQFKDMVFLYFLDSEVVPAGFHGNMPKGFYVLGMKVDGNFLLAAQAKPKTLAKVKTFYEVAIHLGLAELESELSATEDKSLVTALAAKPGIHLLKSLVSHVSLTRKSNVLVWQTRFPGTNALAMGLAALTVAIGAWQSAEEEERKAVRARELDQENRGKALLEKEKETPAARAQELLRKTHATIGVKLNPKITVHEPGHKTKDRKRARPTGK